MMNTLASFRRPLKFSRNAAAALLLLALLATAGGGPAFAQQTGATKLPTTSWVLDRYVAVTGGRDALLRHKSITVHGRFQVPAQKLDVETVSYSVGTKSLQKAVLPGGKVYASGYDGQVAWDMDPAGKVTLYHGDVARSIARDADMYYHLHVLDYFKKLDVVGVQAFDGNQCYVLKGVNNWNQPNEQFYDKDNGLLIGYLFNTKWRGGPGDTTATFENYQDFGGVLMPAKTTGRDATGVSIGLVTSVTYDDVDDSLFALPDAVKNAVAQEKGAQ
ncbi:MAG: hypothetical protein WA855_16160 [Candidatus Acidiferrales bacterium]